MTPSQRREAFERAVMDAFGRMAASGWATSQAFDGAPAVAVYGWAPRMQGLTVDAVASAADRLAERGELVPLPGSGGRWGKPRRWKLPETDGAA